jgi:hypothetical protein
MSIVWPIWLLTIVASFAVLEFYGYTSGGLTLSQWVWKATAVWPPLPALFGLIVGGLIVHFFWSNATQ